MKELDYTFDASEHHSKSQSLSVSRHCPREVRAPSAASLCSSQGRKAKAAFGSCLFNELNSLLLLLPILLFKKVSLGTVA